MTTQVGNSPAPTPEQKSLPISLPTPEQKLQFHPEKLSVSYKTEDDKILKAGMNVLGQVGVSVKKDPVQFTVVTDPIRKEAMFRFSISF